jgi:hypothetical protein
VKATAQRSAPAPPSSPQTYADVREAWLQAKANFKAFQQRLDDLRFAENFEHARSVSHDDSRVDAAKARLKAAFPEGPPRQRQLPELIRQAENAVDDARPGYELAADRYEVARHAESERIGLELQPTYLAAIKSIAEALDVLNDALAAEDSVRAEFAVTAPQPSSALLPDLSAELHSACRLDRWNSAAAKWARHLTELGFLPQAESK